MSIVDCFLLEPTERVRHSLRRYRGTYNGGACSVGEHGYHQTLVPTGERAAERNGHAVGEDVGPTPREDQRWPTHCRCGYAFGVDDEWQDFTRRIYRRADTGAELTLEDAPPGAMWFAPWLAECDTYRGPDGSSLIVRLPNGSDWLIDGRASNCTLPQDNAHKCWVRHGVAPRITVDKNGLTCAAGAGSILSGSYHGFLVDGQLRGC